MNKKKEGNSFKLLPSSYLGSSKEVLSLQAISNLLQP